MVSEVTPGSAAAKLGVKVGWVFTSIDDQSVEDVDVESVIDLLQKKCEPLPRTPPGKRKEGVGDNALRKGKDGDPLDPVAGPGQPWVLLPPFQVGRVGASVVLVRS